MKSLICLTLLALSSTAFAGETLCIIKRLNTPEPSATGTTLFSDVIKNQETFLIKRSGQVTRDFDLMRKKDYLELRSLLGASYVVISHPAPGSLGISIGQYDFRAQNAIPILGMAIGGEDRMVSLDLPTKRLSVTCTPVPAK